MSKSRQQQPSWRNQETRHYCAVCNSWMGDDRQSILLHENGKKHKENVAKSLQEKRDSKVAQEKQQQQLQSSLKAMEQAALQSMATGPDSMYYDTSSLSIGAVVPPTVSSYGAATRYGQPAAVPPPPPPQQTPSINQESSNMKKEKQEWNARKKQRQEEKDADDNKDDDELFDTTSNGRSAGANRRTIAPDEGHYTLEIAASGGNNNNQTTKTTFLEGVVFAEILEEDMPIQIWTGSNLASPEERKLAHNQSLWVNGLVVSIRRKKNYNNNNSVDDEDRMVVNVAYLKHPTDTEETLEQGVRLHRIRIVLGADKESIPETVEEARILAMGGEEIQIQQPSAGVTNGAGDLTQAEIDEATGLTGWSTVSIRRTTVHQQAREERVRERQKQRQARRAAEDAIKEAQIRKMEESKVQNAEDSALGAFDVWSQTQGKGGYKGLDIHTEADLTVHDTGKRLAAKGEAVAFKSKSKFQSKVAGKKRNRRTSSADDDDD